MKKKTASALAVLLVAAGLLRAQAPPAFPEMGKDFAPLRADFNRDAGRVRLVLLLDPT